jgi:hypothetical protein
VEIPAIPGPADEQGLTISLAEVTDPAAADLSGFAQGGTPRPRRSPAEEAASRNASASSFILGG